MKTARWFGAVVGMFLGMWVMAFAQSWTAPKTWSQGELVTPDMLNTHVRDNQIVLRAGGLAISGQAANRVPYASSSSQLATSASLTWDGTTLASPALQVSSIGAAAAGKIGISANTLAFLGSSSGFSWLTSAGGAVAALDASGNFSTTGRYASATLQPGFLAYNSSSDAAVADGATVDFDTESYDTATNFAADTFTAPVTGVYLLCANITVIEGIGSNLSDVYATVVTTAASYRIGYEDGITANNSAMTSGCVIAAMTATDTAYVIVNKTGTMAVVGAATPVTSFSGRLMP
jgi:hypothetical protein